MGSTKITKTISEKLDGFLSSELKVIDTRSIVKNSDKINVVCIKHELNFFPTIKNLKNNHGCPKCGLERVARKNTERSGYKKYEDYQNTEKFKYEDVNGNVSGKTVVKITCKKHNEAFETNLLNHVKRKGGGCQKCRYEFTTNKRKYSELDNIIKLIKNKNDYEFEYIDNKYVNIYCKKHKMWNKRKIEILKRNEFITGSGCSLCSSEKTGKGKEYSEKDFRIFLLDSGYSGELKFDLWNGTKTEITLSCLKHGDFKKKVGAILYDRYSALRNGNYCQLCNTSSYGKSHGENELKEFVNKYVTVIQGEKTILSDSKDKRRNKEIDIFLSEFNIGIEYNGVYHHCSNFKHKNYHLDKLNLAKKNRIDLIQFWEFEWEEKRDIVKSIILARINVFEKVIYGRKTIKKEINSKEANEFFSKNHIQGFRGANKYTGLFYDNELVSCISIGSDGEIVRFANKLNHKVIGGFSKLLKNSGAKYSFVDKRLFTGKSYENSEQFEFAYDTKPNYFYWKNKRVFSRIQFQKHKLKDKLELFDEGLTEFENMDRNGYLRIYDCGNQKWLIKK